MPLLPLPLFGLPLFGLPAPVATVALMQIGPDPSPQQGAALPIPRRRTVIAPPSPRAEAGPGGDRLADCLLRAQRDPAAGLAFARGWLAEATTPAARVRANHCLGQVLNLQGDFAGAERAFAQALDGIPAEQAATGFDLATMAGNAALAAGAPDRALTWLDRALAAGKGQSGARLGAVQTDRARAFVAAGRPADAAAALEEARRLAPDDAEGWLLSATLARRNHDLARAQQAIEQAARLDPRGSALAPAIGLEAGVIAMLAGRETAARQSWQSVVATAPDSAEAATARGYLAQLGPATTSPAP